MTDQTFHTPSFGDEEFDIPELHAPTAQPQHHQIDQYHHQMQTHQMGLMSEQQTVSGATAYGQHQWHPAAESHMMANQTYQLQSPNHSNYHQLSSPNQQMLLMQPPSTIQSPPTQHMQQHPTQISPQLAASTGAFIGQSPPQTTGSDENEDSDENALNDPNNAFKRPSPDPFASVESPKASAVKKGKAAAKKGGKKKKDPNEPQKPVSAYALFFRDTQAAIKGQNPNASFGEVSKIVASMWDVLSPEHKNVYKKKAEAAKKDYLKALAAYRAGLVSQGNEDPPQAQQQMQSPSQMVSPQPQQQQALPQQQQTLPQQQQIVTQQQQVVPQQQVLPQQQMQTQGYGQQMMTQSYQQSFVNQSMGQMNQNLMQNNMMAIPQQQQQPVNTVNNQFMNQQMTQPLPQMNQMLNNNHLQPGPNPVANTIANIQNCIRSGCVNPATVSPDWEDEYCSNECVILHCRNVFGNWVQNQAAQPAVK